MSSEEELELLNASNTEDKEEAGWETADCVDEHDNYNMGTTCYAIEDPEELLFALVGLSCKICKIHFGERRVETRSEDASLCLSWKALWQPNM